MNDAAGPLFSVQSDGRHLVNLDAALRAVATPLFSAELNLASGHRQALRLCGAHPATRNLVASLRQSLEGVADVLERIRMLCGRNIDARYESPYDAALMAMLLVLSSVDAEAARSAAMMILAAPQLWWAKHLAQDVIAGEEEAAKTSVHTVAFVTEVVVEPTSNTPVTMTHINLSRAYGNASFCRVATRAAAVAAFVLMTYWVDTPILGDYGALSTTDYPDASGK
jgi:hypothetical protein